MQAQLASAQVGVQIKSNEAAGTRGGGQGRGGLRGAHRSGRGHARSRPSVSREAKATEALGLARATGFEAQKDALGEPGDRGGGGRERGGRRPHHGRARGARHRRWGRRRGARRAGGDADALLGTAVAARAEPNGDGDGSTDKSDRLPSALARPRVATASVLLTLPTVGPTGCRILPATSTDRPIRDRSVRARDKCHTRVRSSPSEHPRREHPGRAHHEHHR